MPNTGGVKISILPFLFLALLGSTLSEPQSDTVRVKINSEDYDRTVNVPRWVLSQAAATSLGFIPNNNWSYDDDTLPSSIKMDSDSYEIRVDLDSFDQDHVKVKILDVQTIQVEAKQRYVNRYGTATSRTVSRRFTVPRTYDLYKSDANINTNGVLIVSVPNVNGGAVLVNRDVDRSVRITS